MCTTKRADIVGKRRIYLKKVYWPNLGVGAGFIIIDVRQYACCIKPVPAYTLDRNPFFEINYSRKPTGYDGCNGFTLIEILFAMAVASIGLISLAFMQSTAVKANTAGDRFSQATFLAQTMLERVKDGHMVGENAFGYSRGSDDRSGTFKDAGELKSLDQSGEMGGPFNVRWQVAAHTDWSRQVTVTVSWPSGPGRTRHLSLVSASRGGGA